MHIWKTWTKASALALGLGAVVALASAPAAQADSGPPQYKVNPSWPKQLPHNWLIGQVGGLPVDSHDHIWILQRPRTLTADEAVAGPTPARSASSFPAPLANESIHQRKLILALARPPPPPVFA